MPGEAVSSQASAVSRTRGSRPRRPPPDPRYRAVAHATARRTPSCASPTCAYANTWLRQAMRGLPVSSRKGWPSVASSIWSSLTDVVSSRQPAADAAKLWGSSRRRAGRTPASVMLEVGRRGLRLAQLRRIGEPSPPQWQRPTRHPPHDRPARPGASSTHSVQPGRLSPPSSGDGWDRAPSPPSTRRSRSAARSSPGERDQRSHERRSAGGPAADSCVSPPDAQSGSWRANTHRLAEHPCPGTYSSISGAMKFAGPSERPSRVSDCRSSSGTPTKSEVADDIAPGPPSRRDSMALTSRCEYSLSCIASKRRRRSEARP